MTILQINNFHYLMGGAERYYFNLSHLLQKKGHEVIYFSTQSENNVPTKWNKYFLSNIKYNNYNLKNLTKIIDRFFYSREAIKNIGSLLDKNKPDVVHIHNIYKYISPSILTEIHKRNIPVIQTVHDYHLLSPNRLLYHTGNICEVTKINKYYNSIFHKCVKNSYFFSSVMTINLYLSKLFGWYDNNINLFLVPSNFMKNKMIEYGYKDNKIINLPPFIKSIKKSDRSINNVNNERYILYFGRLSSEKGLIFLLDIANRLQEIKFKIIGDGPQKGELINYINKLHLSNVSIQRSCKNTKLNNYIKNAYFVIVPSICFENCPYSILESFVQSKAVLASNIGGIPEFVTNMETGLLFEPHNKQECIDKVKYLYDHPSLLNKMGKKAQKLIKMKYSETSHYNKIIKFYNQIIDRTME